jgi:hypothetical protein
LLANAERSLHYSDHQIGHGRPLHERACKHHLEGIVAKRVDAPYALGIAACGARSNVCTAWNLSWSAGPIRKEAALILGAQLLAYHGRTES